MAVPSRFVPARLDWLDGLRGAAVLGIVPLNARWLLKPALAPGDDAGPSGIAWLWWALVETVLDDSTLFVLAFVFGASLALARASGSGGHYRRLAVLGLLGAANAFVWPGDILLPYIVVALWISPLLRPPRGAAVRSPAAVVLVLLLAASVVIRGAIAWWGVRDPGAFAVAGVSLPAADTAEHLGSFSDSAVLRLDAVRRQWASFFYLGFPTLAFAVLSGWQYATLGFPRFSRPLAWLACGICVSASAVAWMTLAGYSPAALSGGEFAGYLGGLMTAVAAVGLFSRATSPWWSSPVGALLCGCGRASLSIYLSQVLLLAAVAQGWGLGLHGALDPRESLAVVLAVLAVSVHMGAFQMLVSGRFPAERLVRLIAARRRAGA